MKDLTAGAISGKRQHVIGAEPRNILIDLDGEGHNGGGQEAV
jgi:hypothetical protein